MPRFLLAASLAAAVTLAGCATLSRQSVSLATAHLTDAAGRDVGSVELEQAASGAVTATYDLHGLPPGTHGIHVHAVGSCASTTDTFGAAGPHFNPAARQHGLENPNGPHAGDMPNVVVNANGTAQGRLDTRLPLLVGNAVLDADGAAIVIHASQDDQRTDPSGNSGARIACGVIRAGR